MRRELETWISDAAIARGIELNQLTPSDALLVLKEVKDKFVTGAPRVMWLGFKAPYVCYDSNSIRLSEVLPRSEGEVFLIPETDDEQPLPVYRMDAGDIEALIRECPFFEYCVVDCKKTWLVAETEHDTFIVCGDSELIQKVSLELRR